MNKEILQIKKQANYLNGLNDFIANLNFRAIEQFEETGDIEGLVSDVQSLFRHTSKASYESEALRDALDHEFKGYVLDASEASESQNASCDTGIKRRQSLDYSKEMALCCDENRNRRINGLVTQSLYNRLSKEAKRNRTSVNNLIHLILENYFSELDNN